MNARTLQIRKAAMAAFGSLALLGAVASMPAQAAEVGVSIGISQPGVYGRIDIGRFPQPQVVVQQPVYAYPAPPPVYRGNRDYRPAPRVEPVYMWVPPGHQKNWRKHCGQYGACGVPVYFVQDGWYRQHVTPPRHAGRDDHRPGYWQGRRDGYRAADRDEGRDGHRDQDRDRRGRGNDRHD